MPKKRSVPKTRIVIQVDPNLSSSLFLRGEGVQGLSWEKGIELKHGQSDEWIFETDQPFETGEFKVLIDDTTFELGDNHRLYPGASICINPKFPKE